MFVCVQLHGELTQALQGIAQTVATTIHDAASDMTRQLTDVAGSLAMQASVVQAAVAQLERLLINALTAQRAELAHAVRMQNETITSTFASQTSHVADALDAHAATLSARLEAQFAHAADGLLQAVGAAARAAVHDAVEAALQAAELRATPATAPAPPSSVVVGAPEAAVDMASAASEAADALMGMARVSLPSPREPAATDAHSAASSGVRADEPPASLLDAPAARPRPPVKPKRSAPQRPPIVSIIVTRGAAARAAKAAAPGLRMQLRPRRLPAAADAAVPEAPAAARAARRAAPPRPARPRPPRHPPGAAKASATRPRARSPTPGPAWAPLEEAVVPQLPTDTGNPSPAAAADEDGHVPTATATAAERARRSQVSSAAAATASQGAGPPRRMLVDFGRDVYAQRLVARVRDLMAIRQLEQAVPRLVPFD